MNPALTHGSRVMVVVGYEGEEGGKGGEKRGEEEEEEDGEAAGNTSCTHPRVNAQNVANGRPPNRRPARECRSERH